MMKKAIGQVMAIALWLGMAGAAQAEGRLIVPGEGVALAVPDMAEIRLGVEEEAGRASAAIAGAVRKAATMLTKLEEAGVAPEDVQTGAIGLHPQYSRGSNTQAPQIEGYRASYSVTLRLRDLARMGEVLDPVLASGVNRLDGLSLGVSEPGPFREEAETAAVQAAMARAKRIAAAAGLRLGAVLEIRVEDPARPGPVMVETRAAVMADVPVAPGQSAITARVVMEFALEERPTLP